MTLRNWSLSAVAGSAMLLCGFSVWAADAPKKPAKELVSFGTLQSPSPEAAKALALEWFKKAGKTDDASLKKFDALWASDRPLLEKVTELLILGDANAAKLMAEVRDPKSPAPTSVPSILKDTKVDPFLRANLGLAFARELAHRRIFEECLDALKAVKAEQVIDPGAYFFTRAVAEHTLMLRKEADDTVARLLDDVPDAPTRYRAIAWLMQADMLTWQDNDLGWIARKMGVIKDRLDQARGGKKTQQYQKEVLVRLDEMIKEMENKQKQQSQSSNGGSCPPGAPQQPSGGPPSGNTPNGPATESALPSAAPGKGVVDPKRQREIVENWGKNKDKERADAMVEVTRTLPAQYREAIEIYLKRISSRSAEDNK
jgi:hypothetical protein